MSSISSYYESRDTNRICLPAEPCTASQSALGYATCMTITTSIEVSFNQGMSQCKIEYILLDDLSSLVETMFLDFEFDMTEFYPQVGLTKTQFLLEGVYCPPQEEEKSSFEGVVANYLVDALGAGTAQSFLSVCVDVVDTEFIDEKMEDLSSSLSTADVTGRSAPLALSTTTGDDVISSFERKKSRPPRSREQYVPDTPSPKTVPNGATPGSSLKAEYHFLNQNDSGKAEDSSSGNEEMDISPPRHVRPRGDGEGYYIADSSTYDDAGETELAGEKAVMHTHHAPRPRRLDESSPTKAPSPGPTPTPTSETSRCQRTMENKGAVVFDTVVTGRYRGPKIEMEKKVSDVISGNEYQLVEELEKAQPNYFTPEEGKSIQLSLQTASSTPTPTAPPDIPVHAIGDGNAQKMRWRGLIGFLALGVAILILVVCTTGAYVRKLRGGSDDSTTFSLQSILVGPPADLENGSAAESVASSLSAPNLSIEKGGEGAVVEDDEVDSVAALKSILRKHEDSILKEEALFGGGVSKSSQSRVRWAAIFDERSASSHSGSTKSGSTQASGSSSSSPGAYNVVPDVSGGVVVMLREMWRRKETDGSSKSTVWSSEDLLDESCDSSDAEDYSDEDSRSDEEEESSTGTPSFAQFSVYGTALMCKQREEDSMIVTDFKGTASLCQEDETVTTDNRSRSLDYLDELEHGVDQC